MIFLLLLIKIYINCPFEFMEFLSRFSVLYIIPFSDKTARPITYIHLLFHSFLFKNFLMVYVLIIIQLKSCNAPLLI